MKPTTEQGVSATVMAIRECLIHYYKGNVEPVVGHNNVSLERVRVSYNHNYQREQVALSNEHLLRIGPVGILRVKQAPERCDLFSAVLSRSKSFRGVRAGIEDFFDRYLPYVAVGSEEVTAGSWKSDRALVLANVPAHDAANKRGEKDAIAKALDSSYPYATMPAGETYYHGHTRYVMTAEDGWLRTSPREVRSTDYSLT